MRTFSKSCPLIWHLYLYLTFIFLPVKRKRLFPFNLICFFVSISCIFSLSFLLLLPTFLEHILYYLVIPAKLTIPKLEVSWVPLIYFTILWVNKLGWALLESLMHLWSARQLCFWSLGAQWPGPSGDWNMSFFHHSANFPSLVSMLEKFKRAILQSLLRSRLKVHVVSPPNLHPASFLSAEMSQHQPLLRGWCFSQLIWCCN